MVSYSHLFKNFPQFAVIHTVKDFSIVNEAEIDFFFFGSSVVFSMIQQMLAIWSLVPLPFVSPATETVLMTQITTVVWSLTESQTSWSAKWALGSITTNKAGGGDGIPAELFQILKDGAISCTQYAIKFEKFSNGHKTGKG